ncbi:hypothetical protein G647_08417 [Cladophialophora carrionii CBS 160.54]|uniref:Heterokaryon incompatibility domain-containing protein n=1 Tax=Cladophialophora carrionii CBS 160.54 TaxID=1279043 RepID=V9D337_9EURO|nr:uncharacterized protein G647_08417 [Cladophialophora carrionii CBS 160.54]ETI20382.1 hypothetical protein G647_08417 [Cladophialophora carrionii CBS 160.54]
MPRGVKAVLPTRVLDVRVDPGDDLVRLYPTGGERAEYAALSYCWGSDQNFLTTRENLATLTAGIAVHRLPKTIQDAIYVTRQLGIPYLWVDALCIIQDSEIDKPQELEKMSHIYKQATVTISAAVASNCHEGFLHPREAIRRRLDSSFPVRFATSSAYANHAPPRSSRVESAVSMGTAYICPDEKCGNEVATWEEEPIETRAWTLQESWLAPRLLMFGAGPPRWKCLCATHIAGGWRDSDNWFVPRFYHRDMFFRNMVPARATTAIEQQEQGQEQDQEMSGSPSRPSDLDRLHDEWNRLVSVFSKRRLTDPEDKLPALSGIASEFHKMLNSAYLAGLWESNLLPDLLWYHDCSRSAALGNSSSSRPPRFRAPSWSWASIDGSVSFDHFGAQYRSETKAVIRACEIEPEFYPRRFTSVSKALLTITAPLRRMTAQQVYQRFVVSIDKRPSYFSDYVIPDIVDNNEHFGDIPASNADLHGTLRAGPPLGFFNQRIIPQYQGYPAGTSAAFPKPGQTKLQKLGGGVETLSTETSADHSASVTVRSFWFLELARSDGPRGLVLVRSAGGLFERTGYFRLGRTGPVGDWLVDDQNPAGKRDWDWDEDLELATIRIK